MSFRGLFADLLLNAACRIVTGSGSPESSVTAGIGSLYLRTTAGAGTTLYTKEGGTGNTGWMPVGLVRQAAVTLTNAQIKALPTTPIAIIAAPGSGFAVRVLVATVKSDTAAGAYTNFDATVCRLRLAYNTSGIEVAPILADNASAGLTSLSDFLGVTGTRIWQANGVGYLDYDATEGLVAYSHTVADEDNRAVVLNLYNNSSGDLTGGHADNTLTVRVTYLVEPV